MGGTPAILPIALLAASALIMNVAWYWHLKHPSWGMLAAIGAAWGIALFEYTLAVPANRIGIAHYSLAELKTIQEVLSLGAFVLVAWALFGQTPGPSQLLGFALIAGGAFMIFKSPLG
ncbi:DMT family protein [Erythrobacter sp. BLCC-B19]|uniref:DMT family protein n=1 Tax=Erythrobacter sp. BLCC-B19 TaxID=3025315 RepID=UPI0023608EC3|nr:DMT family protein [Erythrobacter sp. BLCC-B19]WDA40925.1 DMT family protein [Erythrobacter sp. BLCC-B19]